MSVLSLLPSFGFISLASLTVVKAVVCRFAVDNFNEGVHYVEPRFAPQVNKW